jgi:hypothetical protein
MEKSLFNQPIGIEAKNRTQNPVTQSQQLRSIPALNRDFLYTAAYRVKLRMALAFVAIFIKNDKTQ